MKFTKILLSATPLRLTLFYLTLVSLPLSAETIAVRALVIGDSKLIPEVYLKTANGYERLTMSTRQPSALIQISTEKSLSLYEKIALAGEPTTYKIVEGLKLPEDANNILILALPSDKEVRYLVIRDDFLRNAPNKWLVINTSAKSVTLQVGGINGEEFVVKS